MSQTWDCRDTLAQQARDAMTTKHTPGPWSVSHDSVVYSGASLVADAAGGNQRTPETAKANANLIAAAPELLAAAIEARNHLRTTHAWLDSVYHPNCMQCSILTHLSNAINKAEGE